MVSIVAKHGVLKEALLHTQSSKDRTKNAEGGDGLLMVPGLRALGFGLTCIGFRV